MSAAGESRKTTVEQVGRFWPICQNVASLTKKVPWLREDIAMDRFRVSGRCLDVDRDRNPSYFPLRSGQPRVLVRRKHRPNDLGIWSLGGKHHGESRKPDAQSRLAAARCTSMLKALVLTAPVLAAVQIGCWNLAPAQPANEGKENSADTVRVTPDQMHQLSIVKVMAYPFRLQKQAIGQIAFNEDASTVVLTPFSGRVTRVIGKLGDDVKRGDPLFEIDSPEVVQAQTDLIAASQGHQKSRSQLALARRVLDRLNNLLVSHAVSQREVDQAQTEYAAAEFDLNRGHADFGPQSLAGHHRP
jgi:biotin carboxyl carrier protein